MTPVLTGRWLDTWATRLEVAVTRAIRDVLSTFPFEPDDHQVGPPACAVDLALLRRRMPWVPEELLAVQRHVGSVSLPDINNGLFLHPVDVVTGRLDHDGRADRIGGPFAEPVDIVVFGSTGGGDLYAIVTGDGRVVRLRDAGYVGGVYRGTEVGITEVGRDLRHFLEGLLAAVTAFADDGSITDL